MQLKPIQTQAEQTNSIQKSSRLQSQFTGVNFNVVEVIELKIAVLIHHLLQLQQKRKPPDCYITEL